VDRYVAGYQGELAIGVYDPESRHTDDETGRHTDHGCTEDREIAQQVGKALAEKSTKTNRGRTVATDAPTMALLERHRVWQVSLSKQAESPLVADPYLLGDNANGARRCNGQRSPTDSLRCDKGPVWRRRDSMICAMRALG
jgi:hypothetical protein